MRAGIFASDSRSRDVMGTRCPDISPLIRVLASAANGSSASGWGPGAGWAAADHLLLDGHLVDALEHAYGALGLEDAAGGVAEDPAGRIAGFQHCGHGWRRVCHLQSSGNSCMYVNGPAASRKSGRKVPWGVKALNQSDFAFQAQFYRRARLPGGPDVPASWDNRRPGSPCVAGWLAVLALRMAPSTQDCGSAG